MARSIDDLVVRDDLYYEKFTDVPFTGTLDEGYERGALKNGNREGYWRIYAEFSQLEAEGWGFPDSNHVDGWHIEYEGEYRDGRQEELWVEYEWQSGKVESKGAFKEGVREGPWVEYHENGQLSYEYGYKDGKIEGPWVAYYDDGQLRSKGEMKEGVHEGFWISYHENGQLSSKGEYENGKQEGPWVGYFDDGQLLLEGSFKNGKKEGTVVSCDEYGTKDDRSGIYRDGEKVADLPTVTDEAASLMALHPLARIGTL
jgi:uncharacterized protein